MDIVEDGDYSVEEILEMPVISDIKAEPKLSNVPVNENIAHQSDNTSYSPMNPVKTITIKKKEQKQNREIPIEIKIQEYADSLYEQYGYGTDSENHCS